MVLFQHRICQGLIPLVVSPWAASRNAERRVEIFSRGRILSVIRLFAARKKYNPVLDAERQARIMVKGVAVYALKTATP